MSTLPLLLPESADAFERYLILHRVHPHQTYSYKARGFVDLPVIEVTQCGEKCRQGESWIYVAVPLGASIGALGEDERLYVGAQTQDRMFRGDGCNGSNYHHAEMRAGNGQDNPVSFLRGGRSVEIYRAPADVLARKVEETPRLAPLAPLLRQPRTSKRHLGWWFEQYVLYLEPRAWRWNTSPAERVISQVLGPMH